MLCCCVYLSECAEFALCYARVCVWMLVHLFAAGACSCVCLLVCARAFGCCCALVRLVAGGACPCVGLLVCARAFTCSRVRLLVCFLCL